jgi:ATP synthase F1 gamma subunit
MGDIVKLKQELEFIQDFGGIIDTFKTAALTQFRLFQGKEKVNNNFMNEIEACFDLLKREKISSRYFVENTNLPQAFVVITSDEGFLGELNTRVIATATRRKKSDKDLLVVLGNQGARYYEDIGEDFVALPGIAENIQAKDAEKLCNYLLKRYKNKDFGRLHVVYPEFVSITTQKINALTLLPYFPLRQQAEVVKKISEEEMLIEPSPAKAVEALIELWISFKLLEIFWSSKQSEYGARIMHLEGSTQELTHLNKKITYAYFKEMHSLSDKSIREISATKILLKK